MTPQTSGTMSLSRNRLVTLQRGARIMASQESITGTVMRELSCS
jgi:hypothetical protein